MQFNEIRKELEGLVFDMLRIDSDNYFEAVIEKNELAKLTARLERLFGSTVWPSDKRLSLQVQEMIEEFGGIRPGQTLYFWNEGKDAVFAMLWPWQDGYHTTVKIGRK
ncbi:MAG: hypothetical protein COX40_02455 [Candidatus Omnitrophica bacterium CG23_combo_of_CG06-09_8_20_14_all_40_11]|nr:MAG: hypothetical protein COX40_02455 [Candidatus Omnitrophica bacterium CG23_combo_of_CG06-09_8_20_14_all_40_11]